MLQGGGTCLHLSAHSPAPPFILLYCSRRPSTRTVPPTSSAASIAALLSLVPTTTSLAIAAGRHLVVLCRQQPQKKETQAGAERRRGSSIRCMKYVEEIHVTHSFSFARGAHTHHTASVPVPAPRAFSGRRRLPSRPNLQPTHVVHPQLQRDGRRGAGGHKPQSQMHLSNEPPQQCPRPWSPAAAGQHCRDGGTRDRRAPRSSRTRRSSAPR